MEWTGKAWAVDPITPFIALLRGFEFNKKLKHGGTIWDLSRPPLLSDLLEISTPISESKVGSFFCSSTSIGLRTSLNTIYSVSQGYQDDDILSLIPGDVQWYQINEVDYLPGSVSVTSIPIYLTAVSPSLVQTYTGPLYIHSDFVLDNRVRVSLKENRLDVFGWVNVKDLPKGIHFSHVEIEDRESQF